LSDEFDLTANSVDARSRFAVLRDKYLELARKYTGVVKLLERNAAQQAVVFRLGLWSLDVTANSLAVVRGDEVSMQNARWLQLDGSSASWRLEDDDGATSYPDLTRLAVAEARRLPKVAPAHAVRRFRRERGDQVIEVCLERPETDSQVVLVIAHDATDQVRARRELSDTREALLQNEQFAVIGELALSVAHDLGNTLRGVAARISVLSSDSADEETKAAVLNGLRESVDAATASVHNLQDVARIGRLEPGPVQLDDVVRRATEVMRMRQPHDAPLIEVRAELSRFPPVLGTMSELSQVFTTLFFNARDAMPGGGRIIVAGARGRERGRVVVWDDGPGFSPEALEHVFQPFFTTKGAKGTGLGLWLAQSTMRRFGGTIAVRNRTKRGAEIELEFQLAGDASIKPDPAQARSREPRSSSC
jgi:signal transduction histidine kinase